LSVCYVHHLRSRPGRPHRTRESPGRYPGPPVGTELAPHLRPGLRQAAQPPPQI